MRVVAYYRVSTNKEVQQNSLETQKSFFEQFCKIKNYEFINIYFNSGLSGTKKSNRKKFLKSVRALKVFKIEDLLIPNNTKMLGNELYIGKSFGKKSEVVDLLIGDRKRHEKDEWTINYRKILKNKQRNLKLKKQRRSNKYLIKRKNGGYAFRRMNYECRNKHVKWLFSNHITTDRNELKKIKCIEKTNKSNSKKLEQQLKKLNLKKSKELDMYSENIITMEQLKIRTKELDKTIYDLNEKIKTLSHNNYKKEKVDKMVDEFFYDVDELLTENIFTNETLKKIIKKIEVDESGDISIELNVITN